MNAPIDVLAVMDRTIARNIDRGAAKGSPSDRDLRAARAAVAELIDAAKGATEEKLHDGASSRTACERVIAALALVGGAS